MAVEGASRSPCLVVVMCGKRKCGKDYLAARLQELLGERLSVLRLSRPLKEQYAKDHGLELSRLLDSSSYKESHRKDMIAWGEEVRGRDPGYFCRLAEEGASRPVWLVCDARRPSDMEYFVSRYTCKTVRVVAGDTVRRQRGWSFVGGVDDAPSECALDNYPCDIIVDNDGEEVRLATALQGIVDHASQLTQSRCC